MKARLTVAWHTYADGAATDRGTSTPTWSPALDATGTSVAVYGWAPTSVSEPDEDRNEMSVDLFLPTATGAPRDVVDLPIGQFEVVGHPETYAYGPFGSNLGAVVKLRRVQR